MDFEYMNDATIDQRQENQKPDPYWLRPPEIRRCGAKTRAGTPCSKWALRGKTRCRNHGGLSTGPRVPAVTTGEHTLLMLKARLLDRLNEATKCEAETIHVLRSTEYLIARLAGMNCKEFHRVHPVMIRFCRGDISARLMIDVIENKKQYITTKSEGAIEERNL
jgi:hypothetical protein